MIWLSLNILEQYEISSISMSSYMLDMTKVIMRFKHYSSTYKPLTVSVQLANDDDHEVYAHSSDFAGQGIQPMLAIKLSNNFRYLAQDLLKGLKGIENV